MNPNYLKYLQLIGSVFHTVRYQSYDLCKLDSFKYNISLIFFFRIVNYEKNGTA